MDQITPQVHNSSIKKVMSLVPDDTDSPMFPENRIDRSHMLRNVIVLWSKHSGKRSCSTAYTAPAFAGPYAMVRDHLCLQGHNTGDFDLFRTSDGTLAQPEACSASGAPARLVALT